MTTGTLPDEFLTLREAAERLRLNPETMRLKFARGKIPGAFRTDGSRGDWRVSLADLQAWERTLAALSGSLRHFAEWWV